MTGNALPVTIIVDAEVMTCHATLLCAVVGMPR